MFGKANGLYDFSGDMNVLLERRKELQDAQNGRKKKINHKVMNVIESYVPSSPSQLDNTDQLTDCVFTASKSEKPSW